MPDAQQVMMGLLFLIFEILFEMPAMECSLSLLYAHPGIPLSFLHQLFALLYLRALLNLPWATPENFFNHFDHRFLFSLVVRVLLFGY